jgi:CRP/FNR family nitrogen fixation transcriptional regulator
MSLAYDMSDLRTARSSAAIDAAFDRVGAPMSYGRDQELYMQDDPADLIFRIVSGVVRTTRLTEDGRRLVGDFYYPGDVFGLETGDEHRFGAEAVTDCEVQVVRRASVRAFAGDAEIGRAILEATRREMARLQDHLVLLGRKGARERVASFLMQLAQREPEPQVNLAMSRQDMADYLGLTIETVSRMLTQLQGDAIVDFPSTRRFQVRRWDVLEALAA